MTEPRGAAAILSAALAAFAERGFDGTSVRDIARRAGVSVAALYYHFPSKVHVLYALMDAVLDAHLAEVREALDAVPDDPVARVATLVHVHVRRHARHRAESVVGNSELRSLDDVHLEAITRRRDELQRLFDEAVTAGTAQGLFQCPYPLDASRAIVTMCTAVASWYQDDGSLSPTEVADRYVVFALQLLSGGLQHLPDGVEGTTAPP